MDLPSHAVCHRALASRDARFDGRLFVGVTSTGIYCRPICPARTVKPENCRFFASAAAAQLAGFRPCLRCRPELSPDAAAWRGTSNTVARALTLIGAGVLDDDSGVAALAERLGVGERQLRRLFDQHLGAPPIAVAQTRRVLFAKQLIAETRLPMSDVAMAAGFGSIRRFNQVFSDLYRRPPSELRRRQTGRAKQCAVTLRMAYRPPYDWPAMLGFLRQRAIAGVEWVDGDRYQRTIELDGPRGSAGGAGSVEVAPGQGCLVATIHFPEVRSLLSIVARLRRLFDLDADVRAIGAHLSTDRALAPLVARRPGLRTPGSWDGFELAIRAVLGQQVTVEAARKLANALTALAGRALDVGVTGDERLTHAFPTPARLLASDLSGLGMPRTRIATLMAVARASVADPAFLDPESHHGDAVARLLAVPGVGPWTAQYWALRALRDSDAFPEGDVALLRSPSLCVGGKRLSAKTLLARAEAWRPWRGYAAQHLWSSDEENARD